MENKKTIYERGINFKAICELNTIKDLLKIEEEVLK